MPVSYEDVAAVCAQLEAQGLPVTDRRVAPMLHKRIRTHRRERATDGNR
jgi:hypothetical protein